NDWAAEFNAHAPDRLCVLPILPVVDAEAATAEMERIARLGHRGAMFQVFRARPPIWESAWDRLWSVAEEIDRPIIVHLGGGISLRERKPARWLMAGVATVPPMQLEGAFAAIPLSGLLDRHKRLKLVLTESGLGWLPYMTERLDIQHRKY